MDRPANPIAWTEGMFLRPHHMQQSDLAAQSRLEQHLRVVDPFHWGVREFALNEEALSERRVEVLRLEAMLPGGTIVRFPGAAILEPREFPANTEGLDVWVGVRRLSPSRPNSAPLGNGARDVRNFVQSEGVPDLERGGSEASVERLVPNVRVFLSGQEEELETHEVLRLCRVEATGDIKRPFGMSRSVSPPLLVVQGFPPLLEEVQKIAAQIAAKISVVASRTETIALGELPRMWMRYTLARVTPVLRHMLGSGETRPFELYGALVEAAGALAAFRLREAAELPVYDHENPWPCFSALLAFIDGALEEVAPTFTELRLRYDAAKKAYVTNDLSVTLVNPRNRFVLGVKAAMESKELVSWVAQKGKAGSVAQIGQLLMFNVPGVPLEHLPGMPSDVAGPAGAEYFKIDSHGDRWGKVRDEFSFALSLGPLADADVRLFIVAAG